MIVAKFYATGVVTRLNSGQKQYYLRSQMGSMDEEQHLFGRAGLSWVSTLKSHSSTPILAADNAAIEDA